MTSKNPDTPPDTLTPGSHLLTVLEFRAMVVFAAKKECEKKSHVQT